MFRPVTFEQPTLSIQDEKAHTEFIDIQSDTSRKVISDITVYSKYARYNEKAQRREVWDEIVDRNKQMHLKKYPDEWAHIERVYEDFVRTKRIVPSMRSFQFAGLPIEINNTRLFNCSFLNMNDYRAFSEVMFLLLSGTGVGFSVQRRHVDQLPKVKGALRPEGKQRRKRYLVGDSIEGWADAIRMLAKSWFFGERELEFDLRDIRPKGTRLVTAGGKAPGPGPLREALARITTIFENAVADRGAGTQLKPIEVHDINCFIADAVLAGGIRRSAMISLFSHDDHEMLYAKSGSWFDLHGHRARANNSAVLYRDFIQEDEFNRIWEILKNSGSGEPGFFFTGDNEGIYGINPCAEISLKDMGFCNLTEINFSMVHSQEDFDEAARAASYLGTLQAGYTDFHYLRPEWQKNAEEEALLGVSLTGTATRFLDEVDMKEAALIVKEENETVAERIGINPAKRATCVKPSGTAALVLGTASGVHPWHDHFYIRRSRVNKDLALYDYLVEAVPGLIEDEGGPYGDPENVAVLSVPMKAPDQAVVRSDETAVDSLHRVKRIHTDWIAPAHVEGPNRHNVSVTVSVRPEEWYSVGRWMWENRETYTGISLLPFSDHTYVQAPFESITEEQYEAMFPLLSEIDLTQVKEVEDSTNLQGELACAGNACEI